MSPPLYSSGPPIRVAPIERTVYGTKSGLPLDLQRVRHEPTELNWADIGTNALDKERLDSLCRQLPLCRERRKTVALALAALLHADSVTPAGRTAVGPFGVQCRGPTEEAGADCAWTLVAWTVYSVRRSATRCAAGARPGLAEPRATRLAHDAAQLTGRRARAGPRTRRHYTAGSSAHDAGSTAQGDEGEAQPERTTAGSSAQDDTGSPARAAGRPARTAEGDAATESGAGSSATAAVTGSTAPAAGGPAQSDMRWNRELGELLSSCLQALDNRGAHENRQWPRRLRARDLLMASSGSSASSRPDDEAINRSATPSATHHPSRASGARTVGGKTRGRRREHGTQPLTAEVQRSGDLRRAEQASAPDRKASLARGGGRPRCFAADGHRAPGGVHGTHRTEPRAKRGGRSTAREGTSPVDHRGRETVDQWLDVACSG